MRTEDRHGSRGAREQGGRGRPCTSAPLHLCGFLLLLVFLLALAEPVCAGTDPPRHLGLQPPSESVEAPAFSLSDLAGKKIQLKDYRGKLVFLNFFATWCGPCRDEMPGMERLFHAHRDKGLVVLAVNMEQSAKTVRPFVQELKLSFPVLLDLEGSVSHDYGIRALPVSFLVGRDGNLLWRAMGGREWDTPEMQSYIGQVIGEKR
jgi:peroxiredoxin